jgi:hypothetical protein
MDWRVGRRRHQRRLILLRYVSSFHLAAELIDLTTVRVAALPLSRLEGRNKIRLLTTNEGSPNRVALCQRFNPFLGKLFFNGFAGPCPESPPGRAQRMRSESRRVSGKLP